VPFGAWATWTTWWLEDCPLETAPVELCELDILLGDAGMLEFFIGVSLGSTCWTGGGGGTFFGGGGGGGGITPFGGPY